MASTFWQNAAKQVKEGPAWDAAAALGGLARWCLKPKAFRLATAQDPAMSCDKLPMRVGACWILVANQRDSTHGGSLAADEGLLRPAYLLPLQWEPGKPHDKRLSDELRNLADEVAETMRPAVRELAKIEQPGIQLAVGQIPPVAVTELLQDLAEPDSGWAALAGGLWCLATNSLPDQSVWSTGCWESHDRSRLGVNPVGEETLHSKVELAIAMDARELFVPEMQLREAQFHAEQLGGGLRIGRLIVDPEEPGHPIRAQREYLAGLKAEPVGWEESRTTGDTADRNEFFELLCRHYFHVAELDLKRATAFRERRLFSEITDRCRDGFLARRNSLDVRPTHLVTIASDSPELVAMAIEAVDAEKCLLFYTKDEDGDKNLARACQLVGQRNLRLRPDDCGFHFDDRMEGEFRRALDRFRRNLPAGRLVFDVTPANKLMNYAFIFSLAKEQEDWLLYLRHTRDRTLKVPKPGSEQWMIWRAGQRPEGWGIHEEPAE